MGVPSEHAEAEAADLEKQFAADSAPEATYGQAADNKQLQASEKGGGKENPMNFTGGKNNDNGKKKARWWTKKKAAAAGSIAGIGVGGSLLLGSIAVGPLEFIHIAQILHNTHFSQQEDAGDGRMGKLYRFVRSGGQVGTTRLGYLGNKYYTRIVGQLADIGITPDYGNSKLDYYKGYTIDTEHKNSPYRGMTQEQAATAFEEKTGFKPTLNGKKLTVNADKFWAQRKSLNAALGELGTNKVATAARVRVLGKFGMVTWHPLKAVDKKINNYFKDKWDKRLKNGERSPAELDKSKNQTTTDKNGSTTTVPDSDNTTAASTAAGGDKAKGVLKGLSESKGAKVAGGVAAVAGVVCALKAVNDNIPAIRYAQAILPAIRVGMDAMVVGYQITSGQDVSMAELSYLSKDFTQLDSQGNVLNTWNDSLSVRSNTGQDGGIDMDSGTKDMFAGKPVSWLSWTGDQPVSALCSTAGQIATGVIGFGLSIVSGGIVSALGGAALSGILTGQVIDKASSLLAGDALDITHLAGAEWGSVADFGTLAGANAAALQFGATALSPTQSAELNAQTEKEQQDEFRSQGFFAQMFDLYDYRSLASRFADNLSPSMSSNVLKFASAVTGVGNSVVKLPFSLYASTVHASPKPYDYGFPTYGFSLQDQQNAPDDPYANAEYVGTNLLDGPNKQAYIDKAMECFGVQIVDGPEGWDAIPNSDVDVYDTTTYHPSDCAHPISFSSSDWLKFRYFIFDTGIMEGFSCAELDDAQSCANNGSAPTTDTTTASTPGGNITGDAASLAQQVLANPNITLAQSAKADLEAAAQNQPVIPGPIGNGSSGLPGCSARTPTTINSELLKTMLAIGQKYKYQINDIVSGHDCDTGKHPIGRAMDIFFIKGEPLNDSWWSSSSNVAVINDIGNIVHNTGQYQFGFGVGCSAVSKINSKSNLEVFNDSCNPQDEIHIDVRGAP